MNDGKVVMKQANIPSLQYPSDSNINVGLDTINILINLPTY